MRGSRRRDGHGLDDHHSAACVDAVTTAVELQHEVGIETCYSTFEAGYTMLRCERQGAYWRRGFGDSHDDLRGHRQTRKIELVIRKRVQPDQFTITIPACKNIYTGTCFGFLEDADEMSMRWG
jgi:hypothetical protein